MSIFHRPTIVAPFTPEQVVALNIHQGTREFHPFTCPNRGPGHAPINSPGDVLVATIAGGEP